MAKELFASFIRHGKEKRRDATEKKGEGGWKFGRPRERDSRIIEAPEV